MAKAATDKKSKVPSGGKAANGKVEEFDVLIVGAGISGVSSAWHLQKHCPGKTYAILENRKNMGGTWDLFRYPGIRSDSDMQTMGFGFKPWPNPSSISDGAAIREYVEDAASESGIDKHVRFGHKVLGASWDSATSRWTVRVQAGKRNLTMTCSFLHMCSGYYSYEKGYLPDFPGYSDFKGTLVHPQQWPEDLDYSGKKVVVIGSGATAVTLVPAMAKKAAHVTMLQRSPTYVVSLPSVDGLGKVLSRVLPKSWVYYILRFKNILLQRLFFSRCESAPEKVKEKLIGMARKSLGEDYDVEKHFTPRYKPWEQRLCLVPDEDFFLAIREGKASVATDHIETFTASGIQLKSGEHLDADIIVTATGLNMELMQGVQFEVDGKAMPVRERVIYKGCMLSDLPNFAFTMGYSNASWTLKADLTSRWVCRLLRYLDAKDYSKCVPALHDPNIALDTVMNLNSGYVERARDKVPQQGQEPPWRLNHNYLIDSLIMRFKKIEDGVLEFSRPDKAQSQTTDEKPLSKAA